MCHNNVFPTIFIIFEIFWELKDISSPNVFMHYNFIFEVVCDNLIFPFVLKICLFQIGWSIISLTNYTPLIIIAMGITGIGAAGQVVSAVYITEIAQDSIRGMLTMTCVTMYFAGLLFSYAIGVYNEKFTSVFKFASCSQSFISCAIFFIIIVPLHR